MVTSAFNLIDRRDVVNDRPVRHQQVSFRMAGHEAALVGRAASLRETTSPQSRLLTLLGHLFGPNLIISLAARLFCATR